MRIPNPKTQPQRPIESQNRSDVGIWACALGFGFWDWFRISYSSSSIFSTLRRSTSRCAMATFLPPVSRGSAPASSCRARLPAMTTNSNRVSLGGRCMKCSYDGFRRSAHQPDARPLRDDDRLQPFNRCRHFVVDHHVLVLRVLRAFAARDVEPPVNLLLAVLAPPAKPL